MEKEKRKKSKPRVYKVGPIESRYVCETNYQKHVGLFIVNTISED